MNEKLFGYKVKHALNQGLSNDPAVAARLSDARARALACQRKPQTNAWTMLAGNMPLEFRGAFELAGRCVLPCVLLVLGLMAISLWQQHQQAIEIEEIDTAVLTGDLPIDAYLDKGFDAWLKRSSL
jgi:hypothetical protein